MTSSWDSVQIASLAVQALTPLTVAGLGVFIARASGRIEQVQWANQTVVTRRLEIFSELAPGINKLFCFATFVGSWKEIQPREAVALKRQLDEIMYANSVLFSDSLLAAYNRYMSAIFAMYASADADAPLRVPISDVLGNRRNMPWWEDSMTNMFAEYNITTTSEVKATHNALAQSFRADLYVTRQARPLLDTPA